MQVSDGVDVELLDLARQSGGRVRLELEVSDPEVVAELKRHPAGPERDRVAQAALRLGVLSLRMASGQVDAEAIREAGQKLVADVRELLSTRATEMTSQVAATLAQYFDPKTGAVPQKLQTELERHLDGDESVLARTLAAHLGQGSPIFRMLSPTESDGLRAQIQQLIEAALRDQREHVLREFSLDQPHSALARLRRELAGMVEEIVKRNTDFHGEVKATLAALDARRQADERSTRHGADFEARLGELLADEAQRLADVHEATGNTTGAIRNCKTGDHVVELGPDSPAPGARVAWEAKEDRSYDLRKALAEIDEARRNRQAELGVFVFSKKTAPEELEPFRRYGSDVVVVWDAEDPVSDVYVKAAYSVTRALAIRQRQASQETGEALDEIERATRAVEKQVKYLDEIERWAQTVASNGRHIVERAGKMRQDLAKEVARLDERVAELKRDA